MKKSILFFLLLSFILVGCNKNSEEVSKPSSDTKGTETVENEKETTKEKDNELILNIDGNETVVPAKMEKDIRFVKEIKIPDNASITEVESGESVVVEYGDDWGIKLSIRRGESSSPENMMDMEKRMMEFSEPNGKATVTDVDLSEFPELESYFGMIRTEGSEKISYYLVRDLTAEETEEIRLEIPLSENENEALATTIAMLKTIK